uniref:Putative DNA helicase ino80 n=1 Tax=Lygus hesperus TaxID=30085 RepID=A0A0A9WHF1_LYGHE
MLWLTKCFVVVLSVAVAHCQSPSAVQSTDTSVNDEAVSVAATTVNCGSSSDFNSVRVMLRMIDVMEKVVEAFLNCRTYSDPTKANIHVNIPPLQCNPGVISTPDSPPPNSLPYTVDGENYENCPPQQNPSCRYRKY